ncbi:MAG: hypothetical protein ACXAEL_13885 [Candidatus Hodarchaeales archaeon]
MTSQIQLLRTIAETIESLAYTGLTTVSESTFQRLSTIINECSTNQFFRLASTLRITTSELKKSMNQSSRSIDYSKYAFFLNQSWLLTKGLQKAITEKNKGLVEKYSGAKLQKETISLLEVIPISIEKGLVDKRWLSFKIHFKVLSASQGDLFEKKIVTWTHMFDTAGRKNVKSVFPAESYLLVKLKKLKASLADFITPPRKIRLKNWDYSPSSQTLSFGEKAAVGFGALTETSLAKDLPIFQVSQFLNYLEQLKITPLDHAYTVTHNIGFPSVQIKNYKLTRKQLTCSFEYDSLTFQIALENNLSYGTLIKSFSRSISRSKKIPYLYGLLIVEASKLNFIPLTMVEASTGKEASEISFLAVNLQEMQQLEKQRLKKGHSIGEKSQEREKHLALLGGLLGTQKKK